MPAQLVGDVVLPAAVLVRRWERRAEDLRQSLAELPWWAWRRRALYQGAIAAYQVEIQDLLETGSRHQPFWHTLIGRQPQPAPDKYRR